MSQKSKQRTTEKKLSAPVLSQETISSWTWLQRNILHAAPFKVVGINHHILLIVEHGNIFLCPMDESPLSSAETKAAGFVAGLDKPLQVSGRRMNDVCE